MPSTTLRQTWLAAAGAVREVGGGSAALGRRYTDDGTAVRTYRRDLLRNGAVGAGLLAAGPVVAACASGSPAPSSSSPGGAGKPKRGGTLNFGRDTGPTQLDPANSIVGGDVYTLDKIFEPLYITNPAGQLLPWLAQGHT